MICLPIALCLYLILALVQLLHKLWWTPGIRGPSYRFIHGNTEEIFSMQKVVMMISRPMNLTHDDILARVQPRIHSWINLYGKNYLQCHGNKAQLVITEPDLIKEILYNRERVYPKEEATDSVKKLLGDGLVTFEGEKWANMRKLANYAFHAERLNSMVPAMISSVEQMLERWKFHEGKEIEVFEEFNLMTSEVISRIAFGNSYLEGKHIFQMLMKMALITSRNTHKIRFPGISKFSKTEHEIESEKLEKGLRDSILSKDREIANFGDDFLGLLVKSHRDADANKRISVEDLVDECKTFYVAGHETTSSLLSWIVFLLATHAEWQEKTRKEVLNLFGQQNPNSDGISKLKTMSMIINESLRLYSPVVVITRQVERKVRLGNLTIPTDMALYIPILVVHYNPHIWGEDVHLFKLERFSEGVAKATNNNSAAYIPFGIEPRNCVGLNFATTKTKIDLSMILQCYAFTLLPAYVHSPAQLLTLRPQHGVQIMLHSL
ncbi:hypothetical protein I3760_06G094600 [Carya illinoinensis]|nr:hypothetical protein I3760_06G094600 [Carya illinoinensis]